ncbi:hypothetical protein EON66_00430 [archaeon]|nr:MAG: hypothetical protein EON66_00430 [archaeon]
MVQAIAEAGVEISVSFHKNAQLQTLAKDRQSGGERALTTMMYLLALQVRAVLETRACGDARMWPRCAVVRRVGKFVGTAPRECSLLSPALFAACDAPALPHCG